MTSFPGVWILVAGVCVLASVGLYWFALSRVLRRETGFLTPLSFLAAFWIASQAPYQWYSRTAAIVLTFPVGLILRKRSALPFCPRGSMKKRIERAPMAYKKIFKKIFTRQFGLGASIFLVSFALGIPIALGVKSSAYVIVGGIFFFGGTLAGTILLGIWFFKTFPVLMEASRDFEASLDDAAVPQDLKT